MAQAVVLWLSLAAAAQQEPKADTGPAATGEKEEEKHSKVTFVDHEGSVHDAVTAREARIHFAGSVGVASADYFRGVFDGVRERKEDLSYRSQASLTLEPWEAEAGWQGSLAFTVGMSNGTSNNPTATAEALPTFLLNDLDYWYESDIYGGVTARLWNFVVGGTYTVYTSPNGAQAKREEVAGTLVYDGGGALAELNIHVKAAVPLAGREGDGYYLEAGIAPMLHFLDIIGLPFDIRGVAVVGMGSDDYYGEDIDQTGYVRLGVATAIGLGPPSESFGTWVLDISADYLLRQDDLREVPQPAGEDDEGVLIGTVALRVVF